jgi:hypothetical protein
MTEKVVLDRNVVGKLDSFAHRIALVERNPLASIVVISDVSIPLDTGDLRREVLMSLRRLVETYTEGRHTLRLADRSFVPAVPDTDLLLVRCSRDVSGSPDSEVREVAEDMVFFRLSHNMMAYGLSAGAMSARMN